MDEFVLTISRKETALLVCFATREYDDHPCLPPQILDDWDELFVNKTSNGLGHSIFCLHRALSRFMDARNKDWKDKVKKSVKYNSSSHNVPVQCRMNYIY
jgi:hypothetical protein